MTVNVLLSWYFHCKCVLTGHTLGFLPNSIWPDSLKLLPILRGTDWGEGGWETWDPVTLPYKTHKQWPSHLVSIQRPSSDMGSGTGSLKPCDTVKCTGYIPFNCTILKILNWERVWKWSWPTLKYYSNIYLKGIRKITKRNFSQQ